MTRSDPVEALDRADAEKRMLMRIIEVVSSSTDLEHVLNATIGLVLEAIDADACFVHLLKEGEERLTLRAASEPYGGAVGNVTLHLGEGVAGWVAEHRESVVIVSDKWSDPRYKYIPELGGDRYTSLASVPLISPAERLIGVVNVHTEHQRVFTGDEISFLEHVCSLVSAAIEHAELFESLAVKERQLQGFVARTVQAQEDERRRVATEIHDGVTQQLISIWYRLNACERSMPEDSAAARAELDAAKELVDEALDEARAAIYDLRPATLDDLGLVPALQALASRLFDSDVSVAIDTDIREGLPSHLETALYRIAQESLNNIRKHASASNVTVAIRHSPSGVFMEIQDDGSGFDLEAYRAARPETSFGLTGMAERVDLLGGHLQVHSRPSEGTIVEIHVPMEDSGAV
jgi:signal transduction histidine kinase